MPNVKALVYIAAFAPDTGDTLQQLVTMNPGTRITPDALDTRPYPLPGGGTGIDLYIKAENFRDAFAGDLPRKTTNLMQAEQRPFSVAAFSEPSGDPAWKRTRMPTRGRSAAKVRNGTRKAIMAGPLGMRSGCLIAGSGC